MSSLVKITDEIDRLTKDIEMLDKPLPESKELLNSYRESVGLIFDDIRMIFACNLDALYRDGRTSLRRPFSSVL